jgi:hypothetical protein
MAKPGTFQKGNKLGLRNPGPMRHNMITGVIISQLHEIDKNTSREKIHLLVEALIKNALGYEKTIMEKGKKIKVQVPPDLAAIREVIDRVEGKAAQAVTVDASITHSLGERSQSFDLLAGALQQAIGHDDKIIDLKPEKKVA